MSPDDDNRLRRVAIHRNRSCLLFGASWSHDKAWPYRMTHFYLGLWALTIITGELPGGEGAP